MLVSCCVPCGLMPLRAGDADNKGEAGKELKEESGKDKKSKGKDKANPSASACFCAVM